MITLRDDQHDLRVKLRVALRHSTSVLAFAPTGFGKTVLASALIKILADANKRVIFCVHRLALLKQTAVTLEGFGIPYGYIAAGYHHNIYRKVNIASIDTLKNRLGKYPADYVFVDEAHLSASAGWAAVVDHYKATGAKIIGLSGSPIRLDGKPLGDVWDAMVMGPSVRWLIEQGFLSRYRAFSPAGIDISKLHTRNGEYVSSEVEDLIAGKAVMAGAVRHWRKYATGKRTIAFAPSIKRAHELAAEFTANGHVFVALDANTPQEDRDRAFNALADRQIDGLVNCNLFSEGFDMSAQVGRDVPIECVLDLYPTQSLARHLQKHGRGLRRKPEPAILLDLVGGFARLGLPDDEREWSLDGKRNGKAKAAQEEKARVCPECFAAHDPAPRCPECGHVYVAAPRKVSEVEGELQEIDVEALRKARQQEHDQTAREIAAQITSGKITDPALDAKVKALVKVATSRGAKRPEQWAAHVISAQIQKQRARA
jgi:superfamily II DNA or RNA helicase